MPNSRNGAYSTSVNTSPSSTLKESLKVPDLTSGALPVPHWILSTTVVARSLDTLDESDFIVRINLSNLRVFLDIASSENLFILVRTSLYHFIGDCASHGYKPVSLSKINTMW